MYGFAIPLETSQYTIVVKFSIRMGRKPLVKSLLSMMPGIYMASIFDSASATTFSSPVTCKIFVLNSPMKSSGRASLGHASFDRWVKQ